MDQTRARNGSKNVTTTLAGTPHEEPQRYHPPRELQTFMVAVARCLNKTRVRTSNSHLGSWRAKELIRPSCSLSRWGKSPCSSWRTACRMDSCADSLAASQMSLRCSFESLLSHARYRGMSPDLSRARENRVVHESSARYNVWTAAASPHIAPVRH